MVKPFHKSQAAREIEARERARTRGIRVAVVVEARRYVAHSASRPGLIHTLQRTRRGWLCSCEGYEHTGCCQHLGALQRRAERDGWAFGAIAALADAERQGPIERPVTTLAEYRAQKRAALADLYGDEPA